MFLISKESIKVITSKKKGKGVFANKDIPAGTVIADYLGRVTRPGEEDENAEPFYAFYYNDSAEIVADPGKIGMQLVNHSCAPTCDTYPYQGHMLLFASRHIFKGEELTFQYFLEPSDSPLQRPRPCHCGSNLCHGTMYVSEAEAEKWNKYVNKKQGQYLHQPPPVAYGEQLPPLKKYPKFIPDNPIYDIYTSLKAKSLDCNDAKIPSITGIRRRLRESGRPLHFKKHGIKISGIMRGYIIATLK